VIVVQCNASAVYVGQGKRNELFVCEINLQRSNSGLQCGKCLDSQMLEGTSVTGRCAVT